MCPRLFFRNGTQIFRGSTAFMSEINDLFGLADDCESLSHCSADLPKSVTQEAKKLKRKFRELTASRTRHAGGRKTDKLRQHDDIYPRGSTHMSGALAWMLSRCLTLRDQMVRVARFSCRFFTAMTGNKNQGSYMKFYALS